MTGKLAEKFFKTKNDPSVMEKSHGHTFALPWDTKNMHAF